MDWIRYLRDEVQIPNPDATASTVKKNVESDIAIAFSKAAYSGCFRFGFGGIMGFNGKVYERINNDDMEGRLQWILQDLGVGSVYVVNSPQVIHKVIRRALSRGRSYVPHREMVAFSNGVLNVDTGKFEAHDEKFETNIYLDYDYDPKAKCQKFKSFLGEVLPVEDAVMVLQEFCGAFFINRRKMKIEKMLFLLGEGQNGKGVFSAAIKNVLGSYNCSSFELSALVKSPEAIATVNGKLANICYDMSKTNVSGGKFKTFVSGEPMPARHLYKDSFEAEDLPLMMASVNEMPATSDHSFGDDRRKIPIPFNVTIAKHKIDPALEGKLFDERSGIFNWIVEGRRRLVNNNGKFSESELISAQAERLRIDSNSVLQFLEDNRYQGSSEGDGSDGSWKLISEFFLEYILWCEKWGKSKRFEVKRFSKLVSMEGFQKKRVAAGMSYKIFIRTSGLIVTLPPIDTKREEPHQDDLPF